MSFIHLPSFLNFAELKCQHQCHIQFRIRVVVGIKVNPDINFSKCQSDFSPLPLFYVEFRVRVGLSG